MVLTLVVRLPLGATDATLEVWLVVVHAEETDYRWLTSYKHLVVLRKHATKLSPHQGSI